MKPRITIIPASIISGLIFAVGGSLYVWHEIAAPPISLNMNSVTPPAAVALLPASSSAVSLDLPLALIPDDQSDTNHPPIIRTKVHIDPTERSEPETLKDITPPIRIEHNRKSDAITPLLMDAWDAYKKGDFDTASEYYSEVLSKDAMDHNSPHRDALLGMAAFAQQRSQDAIAAEYYRQLLALDPSDPDANAGMSSLPGTTVAGTESRLKLLIEQSPEAVALYFALGNHYAEQSRWGEAEHAYFSAGGLEPDNAQFAFNLAVSLDHLGQGKLAIQHYRQALQLDGVGNANFDHAQTQLRLDELLMLP